MTESLMLENLKAMQLPCSSSYIFPPKWQKKEKLNEAELRCGDYFLYKNSCSYVFSKIPVEDLANEENIILVSSHADFVPGIIKPYVKTKDDQLHGTFDNSITNATVLNLMQEAQLPDNIVFALTGDEETGRCFGAKETLRFLMSNNITADKIFPIALDVAYEGYDKGFFMDKTKKNYKKVCYTIENISHEDTQLIDIMENLSDFQYVCSPKQKFPKNLPKAKRGESFSLFDEGAAYRQMIGQGFSLCIPTTGSMHSQKGLLVDKEIYFNYNEALKNFICAYRKALCENEPYTQIPTLTP